VQYPRFYILVWYGQNPNVKGHAKIHKTGWGDASITFFSKVERLLFSAAVAVNALMVRGDACQVVGKIIVENDE
jgi:hypothetical protein